jgi:hypothetical protein
MPLAAGDDLRRPTTCAQQPSVGATAEARGNETSQQDLVGEEAREALQTEGGDSVAGLGGGRRQRWRRVDLLLRVDTGRDREMKRRDGVGRFFF